MDAPPPIVEPAPLPTISKEAAEFGRFMDMRGEFAQRVMRCRDRRMLIEGPLGTGKTRLDLERVRACCLKYPGCRWIMLRSVRKWLTNSALVTWEEKVIVPGEMKPDRIQRSNRTEYQFKNGSVVVVAGLDDAQGVFSSEYDGALIVEAIEVNKDVVEKVDGRLRYNRMPYQQLLMELNPGAPSHWLNIAANQGWCTRFEMRHRDNPALFTHAGNKTAFGEAYLARLEDLTGVRRLRYLLGKWAQAEGVVFDAWDSAVNHIKPFAVPADWRRVWSVDFGYTNPLVWQDWAIDHDGRAYLVKEIYRTKLAVEDAAKLILEASSGDPKPEAIIRDHDREDGVTLERHLGGMATIPAMKAVNAGIDLVNSRMKKAGDGKPRLFIFQNALVHDPDPDLLAAGKPTHTAAEMDTYVWKKKADGTVNKDEPVKENDHGCFVAGTIVETIRGGRPIETIRAGDKVLTRSGYRRVIDAGMTNRSAKVISVKLSNGKSLIGTGNHPVHSMEKGFLRLDALRYMVKVTSLENIEGDRWKSRYCPRRIESSESDSTASCIAGTRNQNIFPTGTISGRAKAIASKAEEIFTAISGLLFVGRFLTGGRFTTKTATQPTIGSKTLNCSRQPSTRSGITMSNLQGEGPLSKPCKMMADATKCLEKRPYGIEAKRAESGTGSTEKTSSLACRLWNWFARCAGRSTTQSRTDKATHAFAGTTVGPQVGVGPASTTLSGNATAGRHSRPINTPKQKTAHVYAVAVFAIPDRRPVFNLTVEGCPEYFANGILVHNCDTARYCMAYLDHGPQPATEDTYSAPGPDRNIDRIFGGVTKGMSWA